MYQIPRAQEAKKINTHGVEKYNFNNAPDNIQKKNLSEGPCIKSSHRTWFYQPTLQKEPHNQAI